MNVRCIAGLPALLAGVMLLAACGPAALQATPDINATVQAALEQTRAVEVVVATLVAATAEAQLTATGGQAQGSSPPPGGSAASQPTETPESPTSTPLPTDTSVPTVTPLPSPTLQPTATPQPTPTPLPTPTPTPTEERLVIAETAVDGSDGDGREILVSSSPTNGGRVVLLPGFAQSQVSTPMVFGNYVTARVAVFDTRRQGRQDGNGIARVDFEVFTPTGESYERTEESAPYCLFGGNDPACPGIDVRQAREEWPDGQYSAAITIEAEDGLTSNWNWTFCIHTCSSASPPEITVVQIGRDSLDTTVSGELVFQVQAYQPEVGTGDGDGIDYVDFYIFDGAGNQVWYKREENAAYCAFGGDVPCTGATVDEYGQYRLVAIATADDGQQAQVDFLIDVQ